MVGTKPAQKALQAQLKRIEPPEFDAQRAMEWAQVVSNQLTIEPIKKLPKKRKRRDVKMKKL